MSPHPSVLSASIRAASPKSAANTWALVPTRRSSVRVSLRTSSATGSLPRPTATMRPARCDELERGGQSGRRAGHLVDDGVRAVDGRDLRSERFVAIELHDVLGTERGGDFEPSLDRGPPPPPALRCERRHGRETHQLRRRRTRRRDRRGLGSPCRSECSAIAIGWTSAAPSSSRPRSPTGRQIEAGTATYWASAPLHCSPSGEVLVAEVREPESATGRIVRTRCRRRSPRACRRRTLPPPGHGATTRPPNSWPVMIGPMWPDRALRSTTGSIIGPWSHSAASVPQMPAAWTSSRTSPGPGPARRRLRP